MNRYIYIDRDYYQAGTEAARRDWAIVTGQPIQLRPPMYVDTRDGQHYTDMLGAIAWPTLEPGCYMIAGATPDKRLKMIDYNEFTAVPPLLAGVIESRALHGYGLDQHCLRQWIGDEQRFATIVSRISQDLEAEFGPNAGIYVKDPQDYRERHAWPLYMRQIHEALKNKLIDIKHDMLIDRLQSVDHTTAEKGRFDEFPIIGILGGLINTALLEEPWVEDITDSEAFILDD